jgi:hypothetical protein
MNILPIAARAVASLALLLHASAGHAELQGRDLDGNAATYEAYYDTALGITWLADMNHLSTLSWASGGSSDGLVMGYFLAQDYPGEIYGVSHWRLPRALPVNGTDYLYNFAASNNGSTDLGYAKPGIGWGTASELGHLFYVTLGNLGRCATDDLAPASCATQPGWSEVQNAGPFLNMQWVQPYWAHTAGTDLYGIGSLSFAMSQGLQLVTGNSLYAHVAYVHDGDVATVPEPSGAALMMLGAALLAAVRRRCGDIAGELV